MLDRVFPMDDKMSYNPYKKYCSRWWAYWLNMPGDIKDFILRVWDYAPLLWEDRDWDYNCALRLVRFKLRRLRQHMEQHAIIAHAEDVVAELARADVLLRNVVDEDPDEEWSTHYFQWCQHAKSFNDCGNQKEHMRALRQTRMREERNWHTLWAYFDEKMRGWCD
jgi:hypothetical protein